MLYANALLSLLSAVFWISGLSLFLALPPVLLENFTVRKYV